MKRIIRLTESELKQMVHESAMKVIRSINEDVLGNNWHENDDMDVANNYEPFADQLETGDNEHDWSLTGDETLDPTVY